MPPDLCRAGDAEAAVGSFSGNPDNLRSAFGTAFGYFKGLFPASSFGFYDLDNLGDDIPRPLNKNGIADADILSVDFILVVQRGPTYGDAALPARGS